MQKRPPRTCEQIIQQFLDVRLPEDEVAFLAMHFNGARNKEKGTESLAIVKLVSKIIEEAKELGFSFGDSFSTVRFISHLKSMIERVKQRKALHNVLLDKIKEEYGDTFLKATVLVMYLTESLGTTVPEDEIGFLTMHLERLIQRGN